jgi:predicted dehydrogenase
MAEIRIGQLGVGYWGPNLTRNLVHLDAVRQMAVYDRDASRLQHVKKLYNGKIRLAQSEKEIWEDEKIQAVVVSLPARQHFVYAKRALEAGKDVLIEKPFAMNAKEAGPYLSV